VDFDPNGKHDLATGMRQRRRAMEWAAQRLDPSR
jgi:hypothetical protein